MNNRDEILGSSLSHALGQKSNDEQCPVPEETAALIDGVLVGEERDKLLGHLAVCSRCREAFIIASELVQPAVTVSGRKVWYYVSATAAVAAMAVIALSITLREPASDHRRLAGTTQAPSEKPPVVAADKNMVTQHAPLVASRTEKPSRNLNSKIQVAVNLLTEEEASLQEAKDFGFAAEDMPKDGPNIKVLSPDRDRDLQSPFKLAVRFEPRPGSKVDLSTLRVECLKIITVDLTSRVRPYVTSNGINMENVKIPAGNHRIRVSVADTVGNVTVEIFNIRVLF